MINQPDIAGAGCQFVANGFSLARGTASIFGLPNNPGVLAPAKRYSATVDSVLCSEPRTLKAKNSSGLNYVWEDSTLGATRIVSNPGVYWLRYQVPLNTPCMYEIYVDTFRVAFGFTSTDAYTTTKGSGMCKADTISISPSHLNGATYIWNDAYPGVNRKVNETGIYYVSYRIDSICEHHVDSFIITYPDPAYKVSFIADSFVCLKSAILFQNTSDAPFDNFKWFFGTKDSSILKSPEYSYPDAGSSTVLLAGTIGGICPDTAYQTITVDPELEVSFLKDKDSICQGESIIFTHKMDRTTLTDLHWQMGDGNDFSTFDNPIKHAYDRAGTMRLNLTARFRACPESSFADTVYVSDLPKVYLGPDTGLCLNGSVMVLRNRYREPGSHLWNTGDTTETLRITHPGIYSLTVHKEPLDCATTASIEIKKDCYIELPNAFSPDGDGINDYFFPKQLLSGNVTTFKMQIFNRWGQLMFETLNIAGRGWDGNFNGKPQPGGVYVYAIDAIIDGARNEHYRGNVTLIR